LEQPIIAPLFSKIETTLYRWPSSAASAHQQSITARRSSSESSGRVRPWSGEKQITRASPVACSARNSPAPDCGAGVSGRSAAKPFRNT